MVYHGIRGTAKQNVERWKTQVDPPKGKTTEEVAKTKELKVGGRPASYLDMEGTFLDSMPGSRDVTPRPGYRMLAVHIEGTVDQLWPKEDPHYKLDLVFFFYTQKEADGSTSLRVELDNDSKGSLSVSHDYTSDDTSGFFLYLVTHTFHDPVKLIDLTIPAAVPVVSFKVMEDGRIKLLLQPGGGAPLVVQAVHFAFERLAQ